MDQLFALNEITAIRRERSLATFVCFIDVSIAYDKVWRPGLWLWLKLHDGMSGRCFDAIRTMYRLAKRSLLINGQLTEEFETEVGVPQGAILSPFLYAVYINGLHKALSDVGLGVWVLGRRVPLLLYADDIVLLARSAVELQAMQDVVTVYAQQWRFELNHRKSNVVGNSAQKLQSASSGWVPGGRQLEVVNEYKHLGAESGKLSGAAGRWNSLCTARLSVRSRLCCTNVEALTDYGRAPL